MPPQAVGPPQVIRKQVWPQVKAGKQVWTQVWIWCQVGPGPQRIQADAAVTLPPPPGGQPPQVWMPPQTEGPPLVAAPPLQSPWVRGPWMNWVNGFTIHPF